MKYYVKYFDNDYRFIFAPYEEARLNSFIMIGHKIAKIG